MTTRDDTVRGYVGDLLAVLRHTAESVERHAGDDDMSNIPGGQALTRQVYNLLTRQINGLQTRLDELGGQGVVDSMKDAVTSVTGFVTGVYGKMRSDKSSRMLRDDYTALHFISICTAMLHTTAVAVNDTETAMLAADHLQELPPLILAFSELVPHAVVADLMADKVVIENPMAADSGAHALKQAWRSTSTVHTAV